MRYYYKTRIFASLSLGMIVSAFIFFGSLHTVYAGCEDNYLTAYPGGIVPVETSTEVSNCSGGNSITPKWPTTVLSGNGHCSNTGNYDQRKYCANGTWSTSTSEGKVVIYCGSTSLYVTFNVNGGGTVNQRCNDTTPIVTTLSLARGQNFRFELGEHKASDGTGWRAYNGSTQHDYMAAVEKDAASRGYTTISEQVWADEATSSRYDTYDFDDVGVLIAVYQDKPTCSSDAVTLSTNSAILGNQMNLTISSTAYTTSNYVVQGNAFKEKSTGSTAILSTSSTGTIQNCAPTTLGATLGCYVTNRGHLTDINNHTSTVTWTHTFKICNGASCSDPCVKTQDFIIYPYHGFIKTTSGGTAYVTGSITQPAFPASQYFATQLFATKLTNINSLVPAGKTMLQGYSDINSSNDFFTKISSIITSHKEARNKVITTNYLNSDSFNNYTAGTVDYINYSGNLTVGNGSTVTCKTPTVILVNGNLNFTQQFVNASENTGCIFVVNGNTTISTSVNGAQIQAYIISKTFTTDYGGSVTIKGGVALQGTSQTISLNKNINADVLTVAGLDKTTPSEIVQYDGARYINIFKNYLGEPTEVSIKEIQYTYK